MHKRHPSPWFVFSKFPEIEFNGTFEEVMARYVPEATIIDEKTIDIGGREYYSTDQPNILYDLAMGRGVKTDLTDEDAMIRSAIGYFNVRVVPYSQYMLYKKMRNFLERDHKEVTIVKNQRSPKTYNVDDQYLYWDICTACYPKSSLEQIPTEFSEGWRCRLRLPIVRDLHPAIEPTTHYNFPSAPSPEEAVKVMRQTIFEWPMWKPHIYLK